MNLGLEQLVQASPSKISISPYSGIQQIKLGTDRESVRKALGDYKEFKKTKASANSTDDFKWVHVYYNKSNKCVAFEIFFEKSSKETKFEVKLDGIDLVSTNFDDVVKHIQEKDPECKVTKSEITSTKFGVIIGKDSVVVFAKEYIQKSSSEVLQSLESAGIIRFIRYEAQFQFSLYGKPVLTNVRIVTHDGIISADQFKTYQKVMLSTTKYVDQILSINKFDKVTINYLTIKINTKVPKGESFTVGICINRDEHIYDGEFLNDVMIYHSAQG